MGGNAGQVIYDDSVQTDYTNSGDYHTHIHQVGNVGQTATKNIVVSVGGGGRNNYVDPDFYANTGNAGNGACPPLGFFNWRQWCNIKGEIESQLCWGWW